MKKIFIYCCFYAFDSDGFAQLQSISFEEIDSLQRIEKEKRCFHSNRLVPIFHAMKTPKQEIIKELNNAFYFIDFNAEEKRTVVFNKPFQFKPTGILLEHMNWQR
jgi:hypothetical protein